MTSYDKYIIFSGNPYEEDVLTIDMVKSEWDVMDVILHVGITDDELYDVIGKCPDDITEIEDKIFEEYEELIIEKYKNWRN